jgi:hypothetical protein
VKLIRNTGADRVIDLLRPQLTAGHHLDVITPTVSLFAFSGIRREMSALVGCRLLLPSASAELSLLGSDADRAAHTWEPGRDKLGLDLDLVAWHAELKPAGETTVVFRDSGFADDVAKTNLTAILQQHGLETVRSL